jgi:aspartyl-tRNA(Asn)/glutamyl-tRNA(Gln) amidotransferase subunit C
MVPYLVFCYTVFVDNEAMKQLALLCRIEMLDSELETLRGEMEYILEYVEKIGELAPADPVFNVGMHHNMMRDDVNPRESGTYTEVLVSAAPAREGDFVRVKKIL